MCGGFSLGGAGSLFHGSTRRQCALMSHDTQKMRLTLPGIGRLPIHPVMHLSLGIFVLTGRLYFVKFFALKHQERNTIRITALMNTVIHLHVRPCLPHQSWRRPPASPDRRSSLPCQQAMFRSTDPGTPEGARTCSSRPPQDTSVRKSSATT